MSFTLTTSGACIAKAGLYANEGVMLSGAIMNKWCDDAEGTFCLLTRKDWVTDYASVGTTFKGVISDAVSSLVAMKIVSYDMSGWNTRLEAQTILDVLRDNAIKIIDKMEKEDYKEIM